MEVIRLQRDELYEKVWTTPMQRLAKELGLSDVGLAKLCKRHGIPTPGRGYWTRVATGKNPARTPLPPLKDKDSRLGSVQINPSEKKPAAPASKVPIPNIVVPEALIISHPHARRTRRLLANAHKDDRGILVPKHMNPIKEKTFHVRVSSRALPRAIRILDVFLHAVEENGHTLHWPESGEAKLTVVVQGEEVQFVLAELVERVSRYVDRQNHSRWLTRPWDFKPTGRLKLWVEKPYGTKGRFSWADGKKQCLEGSLGAFIASLPSAAEVIKADREETERWHREWAEQRHREEEERRRQAENKRKAEVVRNAAAWWRESRLIREFAEALLRAGSAPDLDGVARDDVTAMVTWALDYSDRIDPLASLPATISSFKMSSPPSY